MAYDCLTSAWTMAVASNSIGNDAWSSLVNIPPIGCWRGSWGSLCVMGTYRWGLRRSSRLSRRRDARRRTSSQSSTTASSWLLWPMVMTTPKAETVSIWPKLKVRPLRLILDRSKRLLLLSSPWRHWISMQIRSHQGGGHFKDVVGRPISGRPSESMAGVMGFWSSPHLPPVDENSRRSTMKYDGHFMAKWIVIYKLALQGACCSLL